MLFSLLFITTSLISQHAVETGNIEVSIQNINVEEDGELVILLFNNDGAWLEADQYYKIIKIQPIHKTQKVIFENIPYGTAYAIEVIHDANNNLKMDMRILPYPKPKEGFGLSNNTIRAGPPEYEKAKFSLDKPSVELSIQMKY